MKKINSINVIARELPSWAVEQYNKKNFGYTFEKPSLTDKIKPKE